MVLVIIIIIIIKVVIVVADGLLRVTTITEVTARSTRRGRIIFVSNSNNRINKSAVVVEIRGDELRSMERRRTSFSAIQKLLRRSRVFASGGGTVFRQPALDPKDDVAFENQFQSRRNYNYGDDFLDNGGGLGGTGSYYYDSPAFQYNNKVHITDVFSQASRDSVENAKRVHRKVTQVVAELPATAARIAQTDIVPAFALGLVLSAILLLLLR